MPVPYTHLDVYKRQLLDRGPGIRSGIPCPAHRPAQAGRLAAALHPGGAAPFAADGPVSYTHLDVYKRQPFFLLITAPATAPPTPPMIAPWALLLIPFFSFTSGVAGVAAPAVPVSVVCVPTVFVDSFAGVVCTGTGGGGVCAVAWGAGVGTGTYTIFVCILGFGADTFTGASLLSFVSEMAATPAAVSVLILLL